MLCFPRSCHFCFASAYLATLLAFAWLSANASDISRPPAEETGVAQASRDGAKEAALFALSFIGVNYQYGGDSPDTGMDCSGFVTYVYKEVFQIVLPRTAAEIEQAGMPIEANELKPGDLVFYNTLGKSFSHVGIYLGDEKFIHSPRAGSQIRIENMRLPYWLQRFDGARRIDVS